MNNHAHGSKSLASTNSSRTSPTPHTPTHTPIHSSNSTQTLRPYPSPFGSSTAGSPLGVRHGDALPTGGLDNRNAVLIRRQTSDNSNVGLISELPHSELLVRHGQLIGAYQNKEKDLKDQMARIRELELALECEKDKSRDARHDAFGLEEKLTYLEKENKSLIAAESSSAALIEELQEKLDRANTTIQVQSNQIQNPRDGRVYGPPLNELHRLPKLITNGYLPNKQPTQQPTEFVPWRNRGREGLKTPTYERFPAHGSTAMGRGKPQPGSLYREESALEPREFLAQQVSTYTDAQARRPRNDQGRSFETVIHQTPPKVTGPPVNISAMLSRLFNTAIEWCRKFCNDPTAGQDQGLPREIWSDLGYDANDPFIMGLLTDPQTRYLAVTKLLLGRLVGFALYPKLIRLFKEEYDERIDNEKRKVFTGVSHSIRQESVSGINKIARDVAKDPDWENFIGHKISSQMSELWRIIAPLLDHSTSPEEAWSGLRHIFDQGVSAGLQMMQTFSMFSIDFPPAGKKSDFNKENMSNVDPYFRQDPITLGKMGLKVRLAITPVVNESPLADSQNPHFRVILFSKVLLKH